MKFHKNSTQGFTLAEVLLTLTIIGVVAALSIPSLLQNTQETQGKSGFKAAYSILTQAYTNVLQEVGGSTKNLCTGEWDSTCLRDLFVDYGDLSIIKVCDSGDCLGNCWSEKEYSLLGVDLGDPSSPSFVLSNGMHVSFLHRIADCSFLDGSLPECGWIYVDTNGFKGPDRYGIDIFRINVHEDKLTPRGVDGSHANSRICDRVDTTTHNGQGCARWVLKGENY
ncbi:MAG: hypothetical protein A2287_06170 [Candidatus Melainabacteria bacterium RIFOXYA12_FULL_32_12]|nr:MAG: hypothetical protein A2287_06170 [Candidatus Melainabacteria bacterium RIFOXYA12_FULL_32_12]